MKVCVDVQAAVTQRAGVGRYTKALVENLGNSAGNDRLSLFYFDFKGQGEALKAANATVSATRWIPGRLVQLAWKTMSWPPFNMFAGPADVYHFPNFIIPPLSRGHSVVTIHDASFLRFPEMAEERNLRFLKARIKDTVQRADAIIAVSKFSADEIVSLLGASPDKMHVIYEGISPSFEPAEPHTAVEEVQGLGMDKPFLLTVGTLEPRKNTMFLIEVFEKMKDFDGYLAIVGMPGWKCQPILDRMASSSRAKNIRYLRYVTDKQLKALYTRAELFMFPSLYEGFGFPPLEAMACGAPVISSATGSLPEVLGDAAVVIDGFDANNWAEQATCRLGDRSLVPKGRTQAAKYTWSKAAADTWNVYRKVAG